ncbi:putative disease resistance protein RGA4 isoform X2 [Rhodamnia argentea]|uniref:Disease resistance protein RGA4 isoform X2 n=1 Tax=Rhodamnia argentea TaxID=178133 RepID=A0ABM3HHM0_9MYRT|nr:putative disease resistance protein RGA4 isoform X2 [Rhodamnia argentea]
MAEAVIFNIAGKIVDYLVPQALEKVGKLWGVRHELEGLKDTVSMLRPFLDHAEEQYHQIPHIQVWVEKLKDAFYEAQDVLEEFNIEAMRRELRGHNEMIKEVRTFFSSSNQLAFKLKMSDKVRTVRGRIQAIIKADREFNLDERPVHSRVERERRKREETHSFIREEDIIGRHDDKKAVMNFLLNSDVKEPISILPIVGFGGVGKTALAKCVYQDSKFGLKMWVCVSDDFDVKKIVKNIIACANKEEPTGDTMELLQSNLRKEINGKKYLLVLDDVWNKDQDKWLSLKTLLEGGARGSKILITTRDPLVAEITGTVPPHSLKGLSESASLDLLMKVAGQKIEEIQDSNMLAIGQEIVRKCSGVPLVVRTIGSLLFFKKTESEWLHFKDHELPEVSQREDSIKSTLMLSYDHLPSHLKQCFAFCSLFPQDYVMKKQTLVNLWMAEGFIQPSNKNQHLEDIANGYFIELLWSNFFQDYEKSPNTNEETCKMHDLMHNLACMVSGTECWVARDDTKSIPERTRHISYGPTFNLMGKLPISRLKANALRTIVSTARYWEMKEREVMSEADLCQLIQNFEKLRIMDLQATVVEKVPRSICKLKQLTYLDLSHNVTLKRLPNSITRLQNLQTLNLYGCGSLEELPRGIKKLVSLRNLNIDFCSNLSYMPRGLGQLTSLHMLTRFILPKEKALAKNYCGLGELNGLNNIRGSLRIENVGSVTDTAVESKTANLIGKHSLESLTLYWGDCHIDDAVTGDRSEALLDELRPHSNLQKLNIEGYNGEGFPKWMTDCHVSSLPNLAELVLKDCKRCKHVLGFGLNKLKKLEISGMELLECLSEECWQSLTSLACLWIRGCHQLTSLSLGIRHLSSLEHLDISECWELDISKDESGNIFDFHGLESLRSLFIEELPKLASLPQWLLQLSSLRRLRICQCSNLKSLPEQIEALQSLEWLEIIGCPSLTSLPEGMRRLTSLTHLTIFGCPELVERCKRDAGEDWHKIAHIPSISHHIVTPEIIEEGDP